MDDRHLRHLFHEAFDAERPPPGAQRRAMDSLPPPREGLRGWLPGLAAAAIAALAVAIAAVPHHGHPGPTPAAPAAPAPGAPLSPPGTMTRIAMLAHTSIGLAAGNGVLARTTDGGLSWRVIRRGPADIRDLQWFTLLKVYAATSAGLWESSDQGATWSTVNARDDLLRLDLVDPDEGYAIAGTVPRGAADPMARLAAAGGRLLFTKDGGRTFTDVQVPLATVQWVQVVDEGVAFVAGPQGVAMTKNTGATWNMVLRFPGGGGARVGGWGAQVGFTGARHGFALFRLSSPSGPAAVLYHTDDGGQSWTVASYQGAVTPAVARRGRRSLPGGVDGELVVTGDRAATLMAASRTEDVTRLCSTADGGVSWRCAVFPYAGDAAGQLAIHPPRAWVALYTDARGGPATVLAVSPDGGRTWVRSAVEQSPAAASLH
ncbi:MAG: hypothetical protein ACREPI_09630 [Candidatus Dormibacterales bacterium]